MSPLAPDVVYEIDSLDAIVKVNDAWSVFAAENAGTPLLPPGIIGKSVWDFIADPATRVVYSRLFSRVRSGAGTSTFTFRCDSPAAKRLLEMEIAASSPHILTCTVRTLSLEPRIAQRLLDPETKRSDDLLVVCSWCKRVSDGAGAWAEIDAAPWLSTFFTRDLMPAVSHGMCDECYSLMLVSLDAEVDVALRQQGTSPLR